MNIKCRKENAERTLRPWQPVKTQLKFSPKHRRPHLFPTHTPPSTRPPTPLPRLPANATLLCDNGERTKNNRDPKQKATIKTKSDADKKRRWAVLLFRKGYRGELLKGVVFEGRWLKWEEVSKGGVVSRVSAMEQGSRGNYGGEFDSPVNHWNGVYCFPMCFYCFIN